MKQLLASLISDGTVNTNGVPNASTMRVVVIIMIGAVIASKFYNAWITKTPIVWDAQDLTIIGGALAAKLAQNTQEKT